MDVASPSADTMNSPAPARKDHFDFVAIPLVSLQRIVPAITRNVVLPPLAHVRYIICRYGTEDNTPIYEVRSSTYKNGGSEGTVLRQDDVILCS